MLKRAMEILKNVTIEDNVFVAPFDTGVTDHLNPMEVS